MAHDLVGLTAGLYDFILFTEAPLSARKSSFEGARERIALAAERLSRRIAEGRDRATSRARARLDEALETLRELRAELAEGQPAHDRMERLWKGLGHSYEALRAYVRRGRLQVPEGVVLGPVKPKNYTRNLFHVSMAMTGVLTYEFLFDRTAVIAFTATVLGLFLGLELLRRSSERWNERFVQSWFRAIVRPEEVHKVPAATWYIAALMLGSIAYPQHAIELGTLALGFGDPVAQIVGKRFGKRKIVGQKSWVGAFAFVGAATLAGFVLLTAVGLGGDPLARLGLAAGVGVAGAVAEVLSGRIDDNFTIPMVAGAAATLLLG